MLRPGDTTLSRTVAVTAPELQPSRSSKAEGRDQPPPGLCMIMAKSRTVAVTIRGSLLFLSNIAEHQAAPRWSTRMKSTAVLPDILGN